jgi:hypothetical protein
MNYKKQYLILVEPVPEEVDKVIERLEGIYYADLWDEATRQKVVEWMRKQKSFQQAFPNNFTDPEWYGFRL